MWHLPPAVRGALLEQQAEAGLELSKTIVTAEAGSELKKQLGCPELLPYLPCLVDERFVNGVSEV